MTIDQPLAHPGMLLPHHARTFGSRTALVTDTQTWSYADLDRDTERFGHALVRRAGPGGKVGILSRNSGQVVVSLLAAMRAGLAVCPLNWKLSASDLAIAIRELGIDVLVYGDGMRALAEAACSASPVRAAIAIDREGGDESLRQLVAVDADPLAFAPIDADGLAALISTGGTEGASKAVVVRNRQLDACLMNALAVESHAADDVYLVTPQLFHDPHLYLLPYLFAGAEIVVPQFESFDADRMLDWIEDRRVTKFLAVATMLTRFLGAPSLASRDLSSVRRLVFGGSAISAGTFRNAMSMFGSTVIQVYGQTETCVYVSSMNCAEAVETDPTRIESCGQPVPLCDVRLIDEDGHEIPRTDSASGEIVVAGPSVATSYWNDEDRSAATFSGGCARTGDIGRWDEGGYLFVIDRKKDVIRTGGENVFASIVERALYSHPAVDEVAVIGVPDDEWGERVTAVVVARPGIEVQPEDLLEYSRGLELANYMRPREVVIVDELPKNPSGKIRKDLLRRERWDTGRQIGSV